MAMQFGGAVIMARLTQRLQVIHYIFSTKRNRDGIGLKISVYEVQNFARFINPEEVMVNIHIQFLSNKCHREPPTPNGWS